MQYNEKINLKVVTHMPSNEFTMNYKQANETQLNIEKIISDLQQQNNELSSEISRLSSCRGTKENPHNHDAEIAALSAQIQTNNNWIDQLHTLKQGIADLTALAQATDKKLVDYLKILFYEHNQEKLFEGNISKDYKRIDELQKQIDNNPNMPYQQKDAMLKEIDKCKDNIKLNKSKLTELEKNNLSRQIAEAKKNGANSMQIDAMTAAYNTKAEQVNKQKKDIKNEALKQIELPKDYGDEIISKALKQIQAPETKDHGDEIISNFMKSHPCRTMDIPNQKSVFNFSADTEDADFHYGIEKFGSGMVSSVNFPNQIGEAISNLISGGEQKKDFNRLDEYLDQNPQIKQLFNSGHGFVIAAELHNKLGIPNDTLSLYLKTYSLDHWDKNIEDKYAGKISPGGKQRGHDMYFVGSQVLPTVLTGVLGAAAEASEAAASVNALEYTDDAALSAKIANIFEETPKIGDITEVAGSEIGAIEEGVNIGKLFGSTNGLESHEVTIIDDLVAKGNTVEVIPRSNIQGVKTYDLKVNDVPTELKTLKNPNTGTGAKRIFEGFHQGADTVIIDGRQAGLTSQQAQEVLSRASGKYPNNQIPGNVEIWTNDGMITYP